MILERSSVTQGFTKSGVKCKVRHVTGSFLAYRFVTPVRIMLTGTRSVRTFHVRFGTGPVAGLFGTGPLPDQPVIPVESTG